MKDIVKRIQARLEAAESNAINCREESQKAQELKSLFASFGGYSVGANSFGQFGPRQSNSVNWVKPIARA